MPETPEMVEAVARAIYGVSAEPEHGETWEALTEGWRDNLRLHARAAIQAMREPPDSMCVPGGLAIEDALFAENKLVFDGARDCFNAMLNAALAAPEEGREP